MPFRAIALAACALLMGCASTASNTLPSADVVQYRLSAGDALQLDVFREEAFSGEYTISDEGTISLPMVGSVQAAGKTLGQLRRELAETLRQDYVRDARINLEILNFRPIYILGEVQKPGEYAFSERMSVHGLVAKAGGFTYRANEKVVFIRHADEAEEKAYKLTSGAAVLPGDTVRIDQRYF
ncbi:polysaccharide biosynthesis/export family protein [Novosphingobium malaysiense]|uniref:Uncharacterized protein n=1 Tax=Novosphingobium malaysiense TaxID=1348853 RepID=A0A0B1ZQ32_9SPHN|nr:polysaccharide biosynthesis/export family protein [Novosphingobium malaysiense]KHK93230.1 hypothetical protein LK12_02605 [Novosphingobium malaysiense]